MPKVADIERKWYVVDAEGQVLGRVASQVANILRGKNKPIYTAKTNAEATRATNLLNVVKDDEGLKVSLGEVYLMYNDVFYYSQACTIPKGGVYLAIPKDTPAERARASYALGSRGDTTGIDHIIPALSNGEGAWYGIDGRKYDVMPKSKGIYIKDGKKIIIK